MKFIFQFLILLIPVCSAAHPGVGIVKDSKGNFYYTDLSQVWKICSDGKKSIAVPHVHTHELYMDEKDNLFGEHIWYNGERLNTWGSYAWCLRNNGTLDTVIKPHEGFLMNYSFCRDKQGNQYWAEKWKISRIKMKTPDGTIRILAEGNFRDIRWMHVTGNGTIYFIDLFDLYRIGPDKRLHLMVKDLAGKPSVLNLQDKRHSVQGIWTDHHENIYVAVSSEKKVKKILPDGSVQCVVNSYGTWSPSGGAFDDYNNLWLLEYNILNQVRVRKITAKQLGHTSKIKFIAINVVMPVSIIGSLLILLMITLVSLIRKIVAISLR